MDVGEHAAFRDRDSREELVELLVVADGELNVAGSDALFLVVAARVSSQLQNLRAQILFVFNEYQHLGVRPTRSKK